MDKLVFLEKVNKKELPLVSKVATDEFTNSTNYLFDYEFNGVSEFYPYEKPSKIPNEFNIGVIVGASGSGKSTLMKEFGEEEVITWDKSKSIMSHFKIKEEAVDKLTAVGLNSIPAWVKPYNVLSNGEKFRADLARKIKNNTVIDEFTSVVDRNVAKASSTAISKYIKKNNIKNIVLVTCHEDIVEWLEPDWVFNTNEGVLYSGKYLRRPKIELDIYETKDSTFWEIFKEHHYLTSSIHNSARKFIAVWNGEVVGFSSSMHMPSGTLKKAWRGHRTVVLPDYQGLGIGVRLSDAVAQIHIEEGKRYFSKTVHIRMGTYREKSPLWKPTSKNRKVRKDVQSYMNGRLIVDQNKTPFSHEYIGFNNDERFDDNDYTISCN